MWLAATHYFESEIINKLFTTVAQKGQSQINLPKHKPISRNTIQFTETQNDFPKHKPISQSTNQFPETQFSLPKHKTISQNTNQFSRNTNQKTGHLRRDYQREPGRTLFPVRVHHGDCFNMMTKLNSSRFSVLNVR